MANRTTRSKLSARDQRLLGRYLRAAAKIPLKTQIAFMDTLAADQGIHVPEAAKLTGIKEEAGWGILYKPPTHRQRVALEVKGLPREKKQAFLDAMKDGKTLGEAQNLAGISLSAAACLLRRAMTRHTYITMDWVAK